jgi:hypothetical protein
MTGDLPGADGLFRKYLSAGPSAQPELAGFQQAQWEFLTGRRKMGMQRLEQILTKLPGETPVLGACQLSIWKLQTGDSKGAVSMAEQAARIGQSPGAKNMGAMCLAVAGGSSSSSALANGIGLMLARKYAEALPVLEKLYRETNPTFDGQIRILLAWAYVENGRAADAKKLVGLYPIPLSSGDALFASLIFPRFLFLRGTVLGEKKNLELNLKFVGQVGNLPPIINRPGAGLREKADLQSAADYQSALQFNSLKIWGLRGLPTVCANPLHRDVLRGRIGAGRTSCPGLRCRDSAGLGLALSPLGNCAAL